MKNLISFLFLVASVLSGMGAEPIYRNPRVSPSFGDLIQKMWVEDHFVIGEGEWSSTMSSIQKVPDYFVVWSSNKDGGRILKMDPFKTDSNGVVQPPKFTDVVTGESQVLPYQTYGASKDEEYYHYGVLTLGEDKYNVAVAYGDSLSHPGVMITWGTGSDIFDVGVIADSFEEASVADKVTENKVSMVKYYEKGSSVNGTYLLVDSPKEFGQFTVKVSTDLITWSHYMTQPLAIMGETLIYKLPDTGSAFFSIE